MKKNKTLLPGSTKSRGSTSQSAKEQSLQDKTGASAEQIRKAMEKVGFDREKVEEYLIKNSR